MVIIIEDFQKLIIVIVIENFSTNFQLQLPELESSRTHFEVLCLGLEASSP